MTVAWTAYTIGDAVAYVYMFGGSDPRCADSSMAKQFPRSVVPELIRSEYSVVEAGKWICRGNYRGH